MLRPAMVLRLQETLNMCRCSTNVYSTLERMVIKLQQLQYLNCETFEYINIFFFFKGDLERLRRYWMTGACKPGKQERKSSDPLALEQFLSAFLLLMSGILLAAALLFLEHIYFKYARKHLAKTDRGGCCALISLVRFIM